MTIASMFIAAHDTDTTRVCSCCMKSKPVDEFYKDGKDAHGKVRYRRDCKECYKLTRAYDRKDD